MATHPSRRSALTIAWTGAALFAMSLAWFVYSYLVRFGRPAPPGRISTTLLLNAFLFTAFALHHSVLARSGAKEVIGRIVPPGLERSLYTWVSSLLFLAVCTWWQPVPGILYRLEGTWRMAAWTLQVVGILLTVHASSTLDVLDLAGVRAVQRETSASDARARKPALLTRGIYGVVRHPLYFAWALFVFSTPTMTGARASFAIISTAYLMIAIPWEEHSLVESFGPEYEAYRRQVKTRMIPWLY